MKKCSNCRYSVFDKRLSKNICVARDGLVIQGEMAKDCESFGDKEDGLRSGFCPECSYFGLIEVKRGASCA